MLWLSLIWLVSDVFVTELMQTEFHHIQTLSVMADVLRPGLLEEVQLEQDMVSKIFPKLDELLALHRSFLVDMEARQRASIQPGMRKNYIIRQIGDILCQQASENPNIWRFKNWLIYIVTE